MQRYTEKQIREKMLMPVFLENPLRKWKRRLIVALTEDEKQKCKAKIKEYERIYDR
jgi:hypothetical protein